MCGRRDPHRQRLQPLPNSFAEEGLFPKAQIKLPGGLTVGIETESHAMPNGAVSNRASLRIKMPF